MQLPIASTWLVPAIAHDSGNWRSLSRHRTRVGCVIPKRIANPALAFLNSSSRLAF